MSDALNPTESILQTMARLETQGEAFVSITMVEATGSTPQDAGSRALVTAGGLCAGTVGGGRVETKAIEIAREVLRVGGPRTQFIEWNLQRDVGMTCGGVVKFFMELVNPTAWRIAVFGAGHVAQALTRLLATLPCMVDCFDPRPEWIERLPHEPRVRGHVLEDLQSEIPNLPDSTYVLSMTMGHKFDRPILERIFRDGRRFAYLGVIGSASKAAILRKELAEAGIAPEQAREFRCPVGLPIGTNHPGEIAVSIAAELIQVRDKLAAPDAARPQGRLHA